MSRYENACPLEARNRANHCESCTVAHASVPPCVAAYLGGAQALTASNVLPLHRIEVVNARKAA